MAIRKVLLVASLLLGVAGAQVDVKIKMEFELDDSDTCTKGADCDLTVLSFTVLNDLTDEQLGAACNSNVNAADGSLDSPQVTVEGTAQYVTLACLQVDEANAAQLKLVGGTPDLAAAVSSPSSFLSVYLP